MTLTRISTPLATRFNLTSTSQHMRCFLSGYLQSVIIGGKYQPFRLSPRPRDHWHELLSAIQVTSPQAKKYIRRGCLRCCYLFSACQCVYHRYHGQTQRSADWVDGETLRWFNLRKHLTLMMRLKCVHQDIKCTST